MPHSRRTWVCPQMDPRVPSPGVRTILLMHHPVFGALPLQLLESGRGPAPPPLHAPPPLGPCLALTAVSRPKGLGVGLQVVGAALALWVGRRLGAAAARGVPGKMGGENRLARPRRPSISLSVKWVPHVGRGCTGGTLTSPGRKRAHWRAWEHSAACAGFPLRPPLLRVLKPRP